MRSMQAAFLGLCANAALAGAGPLPFLPIESLGRSLGGARALEIVDLDRDGRLDVLGLGEDSGDLLLFRRSESGVWTDSAILEGIDEPTGLAGDVGHHLLHEP